MNSFICLILLYSIPLNASTCDHFDKVEVNHFYDDDGIETFTQIIFWDLSKENKWKCQYWKLMEDAYIPLQGEELDVYKKKVDKFTEKIKNIQDRSELRKKMYSHARKFVGGNWYPKRRWNKPYNYEIIVNDDHEVRHITSDLFIETHTKFDPEKNNRKLYPEEERRGLKNSK